MQVICCLCSGITIYLMVRGEHLQSPFSETEKTDRFGRSES